MSETAIEWTDATWNPTTGCDRISPGCDNCYALTMAKRLKGMGSAKYQNDGDPRTSGPGFALTEHADALDAPLRWRKPRKVFVNSMSDLFHKDVSDEFIAQVFAVMALTPQHTYQVLTKRPQRMADWFADAFLGENQQVLVQDAITHLTRKWGWERPVIFDGRMVNPDACTTRGRLADDRNYDRRRPLTWPLPNVWLGTSIENDRYTFRADHLRRTPAAVRFISAEPLLGPLPSLNLTGIDWLIVGGESGPGARPMHPGWVRNLRDRCSLEWDPGDRIYEDVEPHTAFFFKQWGAWGPTENDSTPYGEFHGGTDWVDSCICSEGDGPLYRVGKHDAGRTLDGRTWDEYPPAARVEGAGT